MSPFNKILSHLESQFHLGSHHHQNDATTSVKGPVQSHRPGGPVYPKVKGTPKLLGLVDDPEINRDSLGSVKFGSRIFWTARDSQPYGPDGKPTFPIYSSSASWSDVNEDGSPKLQLSWKGKHHHLLYGDNHLQPYFPILSDRGQPNSGGGVPDGTRYAIWPDSPPLVTKTGPDGSTVAYTWVKRALIRGDMSVVIENPSTTLYRIDYVPEREGKRGLPRVSVVEKDFWGENRIPFGAYGGLVSDGIAYLWGQASDHSATALAKVPVDSVEEKSAYQFWVNGQWVDREPHIHDAGIDVPNVSAGGQGTYYFSEPWQSYVWIGQSHPSVAADFYITTAPEPQGPWIKPFKFHTAQSGSFILGAYSLQANPALVRPGENAIYLTYTKTDDAYTTPLIQVEWE